MKKTNLTKSEAQTRHTLRRAHERYGKALEPKDLAEMRKMIQTGYSRYMKKLSCSRRQHCVSYKGTDYIVVYDKTRKQICSCLPKE